MERDGTGGIMSVTETFARFNASPRSRRASTDSFFFYFYSSVPFLFISNLLRVETNSQTKERTKKEKKNKRKTKENERCHLLFQTRTNAMDAQLARIRQNEQNFCPLSRPSVLDEWTDGNLICVCSPKNPRPWSLPPPFCRDVHSCPAQN